MYKFVIALMLLCSIVTAFINSNSHNARTSVLYMGVAPKPSGFANTKAGKAAIFDRTKKLVDGSSIIISMPFEGVTKEQVDMLRKEIPKTSKGSVIKNSIMRKACVGTPFEVISQDSAGETMYFFVPEGEGKPVYEGIKRWQKEVKRTEEKYLAKNAIMDSILYQGKNVESVCNLPTKKELITKIAQGIKAVPTKVGRGVNAVPNKLGRAFGALRDKLEDESK